MALYLNKPMIGKFCSSVIKPTVHLPQAKHLFNGTWVINTKTQLRFVIVCHGSRLGDPTVIAHPPTDVVNLQMACTAVNDYLFLPAFYHNESTYEIGLSDPNFSIGKINNISKISIWDPVLKQLPSFNESHLPRHLKVLDQVPMESLIHELSSIKAVNVSATGRCSIWVYIAMGLVISIGLFIVIRVGRKFKCSRLAMHNSSRLSSVAQSEKRVMLQDIGSDDGPEGRMVILPSAPLMRGGKRYQDPSADQDKSLPQNNDVKENIYPKLNLH
jgi:hypothetical protein